KNGTENGTQVKSLDKSNRLKYPKPRHERAPLALSRSMTEPFGMRVKARSSPQLGPVQNPFFVFFPHFCLAHRANTALASSVNKPAGAPPAHSCRACRASALPANSSACTARICRSWTGDGPPFRETSSSSNRLRCSEEDAVLHASSRAGAATSAISESARL